MFSGGNWFAWFPVLVRTSRGKRWAWLENVWRERVVSQHGSGPYRYYA
ncbi:hypothetical protein EDF70_1011200 [Neorhizobium sp. JUb45]|nr:hypothetical protein EDF70_1011200 [Neorhizobium sp. JUb45]